MRCGEYGRHDIVGIPEYIVVPETQDAKSAARQFFVTDAIVFVFGMLTAIDLDNQSCLETSEVSDVSADWYLPTELESIETAVAKARP